MKPKVHLVVTFAEEFQPLGFLVHKHTVQMSSFHIANLNGLVAPAHNLTDANEGHAGRHLTPLQHHVLEHLNREKQNVIQTNWTMFL